MQSSISVQMVASCTLASIQSKAFCDFVDLKYVDESFCKLFLEKKKCLILSASIIVLSLLRIIGKRIAFTFL